MSKIMLVEDDNNLREIYEARLQAEGYTIIAAKDGEEALVLAKNEKPDLVISDVMMPKISGFEMLDILRNTDGLKEVKVIMLTALGQSDDQQRADRLGADRYLVKSQVTLEDIVKVAHQLLEDEATDPPVAPSPTPAVPSPTSTPTPTTPADTSAPANSSDAAVSATSDPPAADSITSTPPASTVPTDSVAQSTAQEEASVEAEIANFVTGASSEPTTPESADPPIADTPQSAVTTTTDPVASAKATTAATDDKLMADAVNTLVADTQQGTSAATGTDSSALPANPVTIVPSTPIPATPEPPAATPEAIPEPSPTASVPIAHKKIISPIDTGAPKQDLKTLLALEEAKEAVTAPQATPSAVLGTNDASAQEVPLDAPAGTSPTAEPTSPATDSPVLPNNPLDPNSIAL